VPALLWLAAACTHAPQIPSFPPVGQTAWEPGQLPPAEIAPFEWWTSFREPVLDDLVTEALARNLDIRLAAERVIEARALSRGAGARLAPDIGMAVGAEIAGRDGPAGERDSASLGIDATWQPDLSGRLRAALRAARADTAASEADVHATRFLLVGEVVAAFVELRLQQTLIALTEQNVSAQEETLRITRDRFEFGLASKLEVERTVALTATTRSELASAREGENAARFRLAYLLATTPEELRERLGSDGPIPHANPLAVMRSPEAVIAARPDVRASAARYAAATSRREEASALRLPTVTISGFAGADSNGLGQLLEAGAGVASLAASLFTPVFDFGRRASERQVADSRLRQAAILYETTVRRALFETQTAAVRYVEGQSRERELALAADAAQRAVELSRFQYREGTLSQLEVLDAARTAYRARRDQALSRAQVASRLADLYRMMAVAPQ